jgi:PAS domain S-box-containing protein
MPTEPAYLVADQRGACVHANEAALELLGMDQTTLGCLKVSDLFPAGAPDGLRQRLDVAAETESWAVHETDLIRADGSTIRVSLASMRAATGELVLRLERPGTNADPGPVRDVLQAWRQQELELSRSAPGTPQHLVANADAQRLSSEYRRIVSAHSDELRDH